MPTTPQLLAFAYLSGGVKKAADKLGVSAKWYQRYLDDGYITRDPRDFKRQAIQYEIDKNFADYFNAIESTEETLSDYREQLENQIDERLDARREQLENRGYSKTKIEAALERYYDKLEEAVDEQLEEI